ncbi:hypothetical protein [Paenibacillus polymyxa]|uniref:hypothetical protein n=1 Tax=Paenibacillus polymyxa TaxID=1406 RepID=UPI0025B6E45E|nr:hypothetical protein [Paenibacillus polymyxa]MDN4106457.1 hypothetical protein [Paenibacillus polymyxa]
MFRLFGNKVFKKAKDVRFKKNVSTEPSLFTDIDRFYSEAFLCKVTDKSSSHLLRRITDDLIRIARGEERSLVVVEEKGTLLRNAEKQMNGLAISPTQVVILSSCNPQFESGWNPLLEEHAPHTVSKALARSLSVDENLKSIIERDCVWMIRLAKAFFQENANFTHLLHLYKDCRYLANVVIQLQENKDMDKNPEWSSIIDYFNNYIFSYLHHEHDGVMLPSIYPIGHLYESQQIVISRHETMNVELIRLLEEILCNRQLSKILNSTSTFRVRDAINSSKIVFIHSSNLKGGKMLGNLFLYAFVMELVKRPTVAHSCFLTVDDSRSYDLLPIEWILQKGKELKSGGYLSFKTYTKSLFMEINQLP